MFESAGVQAEATYEAESKPLIAGLVAQGLGALPVLKESAQQMPKLAAVPIKTPENALPFSLIHAKRKFMSPAAQRFCKYVLAESSKKPDSSKKRIGQMPQSNQFASASPFSGCATVTLISSTR